MAKTEIKAQRSWLADANSPTTDFPLAHLPYGAFFSHGRQRLCVAIGNHLLDLAGCVESNLIPEALGAACTAPTLNSLMALSPFAWNTLRRTVTSLLAENPENSGQRQSAEAHLHSIAGSDLRLAVAIPDYTDFYTSIHHATRVGMLFRPDQPLLPNYKFIPIGYHGRASSIVCSGTDIRRPHGQVRPASPETLPRFVATNALDYELELAFYIGTGNSLGVPVSIDDASSMIFGVSLLNDWSARDIQSWEYQPLGPFLGKNFATTVSSWITPYEALETFRVSPEPRSDGVPRPLPYLSSTSDHRHGAFDIEVEVYLSTAKMRENQLPPALMSTGNPRSLFWTPAQMIAHHTSNGCNLRPGDLLATGTISGPQESSAGCLLELTQNGTKPLALPTGEIRCFLEDHDEVILRAFCQKAGHPRIGFGECRGTVTPAHSQARPR